jgi:hypothetical protein
MMNNTLNITKLSDQEKHFLRKLFPKSVKFLKDTAVGKVSKPRGEGQILWLVLPD